MRSEGERSYIKKSEALIREVLDYDPDASSDFAPKVNYVEVLEFLRARGIAPEFGQIALRNMGIRPSLDASLALN